MIDDADLGETIAIRSMVYLALTYDHRLVDGADARPFPDRGQERLEDGASRPTSASEPRPVNLVLEAAGREVRITHPDKLVFPGSG